jgi:hypothetical protein
MPVPVPGDDKYDSLLQGVPVSIVANSIRSTSGVLQLAAVGTGVGTPLNVAGFKVVMIQVLSTATSFTMDIEGSVDGSNYVASCAVLPVTDATQTTYVVSISTAGIYSLVCAGFKTIQANISAITPGPGTVTIKATAVA